MSEARNEERKVKREMWKFTPLAACSPPCFSTRQGNRMNAMRLPVKGEEGREKGAPGLLFRPAPGKNAVCFRRSIADRRFYPSLFSLHPSRNRFMRLPWALRATRFERKNNLVTIATGMVFH